MQVSLERTGGFTGISKKISVDTNTLPLQVAEELSQLVEAADFFQLPEQIMSDNSQCDRFHYKLTVEDHGQQHSVITSEPALTNTLKTLIEYLNQVKTL
ncbi:protealysin inhibitor emfourin [Anabaena sp. UHCC 0399]|uniref:protealysin inhibitor emfourin n=1 Tax=Anabaena sp. UHCC 0399 TaxID=3110238 RepID=UPI002B202A4D|nr:protealysin inhibitor emfourin [Anabaena sp. UHCC 0399]MEA5564769.1 protealysin inhibitor emfourin [Anabaena sp. UHCC 0399]